MSTRRIANLEQYGLLLAAGADARPFLHAQLTNDIENLPAGQARYAGWCSAKGRLLATFLVIPFSGGFLLQLARDLVPAVQKRLSMFVLRSKVTLSDVTGQWQQYGAWDEARPAKELETIEDGGKVAVRLDSERVLLLTSESLTASISQDAWMLAEVRAGRALITQATQDQFVPQMVNLELSGGVDFQKGCYPGQEIVARAQYRGEVKRRLYRLRGAPLQPGQPLYTDESPDQASGTVVNAAGDEALAVVQVSAVESGTPIRVQPRGAVLEPAALPYSR